MNFLPEEIEAYALKHTEPESDALADLNRETWQKVLQPRMLSGHLQGRVLSMLSHLVSPTNVLEIGTYTGYSTICLAEGLAEGGKVHTIDINEELKSIQQKYFDRSGMTQKIEAHVGNALHIIPDLDLTWDLVFIDADKENYVNYLDMVLPRMRKGGLMVFDNVLWSGKVVQKIDPKDEETRVLVELNKKVQESDELSNVLLPVRDGLMIARKL